MWFTSIFVSIVLSLLKIKIWVYIVFRAVWGDIHFSLIFEGFPRTLKGPKIRDFFYFFSAWSYFVEWLPLSGSAFFLAGIRSPAPRVKIRRGLTLWAIDSSAWAQLKLSPGRGFFWHNSAEFSWLEVANPRTLLQIKAGRRKGFVTSNPRRFWVKKLKEDFYSW